MIEKKFCKYFDSSISFLEVEIEENVIKYTEFGSSFYKIYIWQQELINKMLKSFDEVILEINYVEGDFTKRIKFKEEINIYDSYVISNQCVECKNRIYCSEFQKAFQQDFIVSADTDEKLYNLYLLAGAKKSAMEGIEKSIRKTLDAKIQQNGGVINLKEFGLSLSINHVMTDEFPIKEAIDKKLINENNCKLLIAKFREDIKGTEHEKMLKKKLRSKKLQIGNIENLF